ncbi:MAG: HTTM domain-containing protein [Balneolales bacterium]
MRKFDRWIFNSFEISPESLGLYRILFALFVLFIMSPGHSAYTQFALLSTLPGEFFDPPPGPMMLFNGFPGEIFFHGLVLVLNISLVALLVGYRTFWSSIATGILLLIGFGFSYSLGKINHNLLVIILPLILMWSNWGAAYSIDAINNSGNDRKVETWPLSLLLLFLGFMMFTAGFPKLLGGWLDPETMATRGHLFRQYYVSGRTDLMAGYFLAFDVPWFWVMLDYFTVCFEIGFLFAIIHPVTTRLFLVLAVIFHSGTLLMLNIDFAGNILIYGSFVDWKGFMNKIKRYIPIYNLKPLMELKYFPILIPFLGGIVYFLGSPFGLFNDTMTFASDLRPQEVLVVFGALMGTLLYYSLKVFSILRRKKSIKVLSQSNGFFNSV